MPPDDADPVEDEGADQNDARTTNNSSQGTAGSTPHVVKRRLIKKTRVQTGVTKPRLKRPSWFPKSGTLAANEMKCLRSFTASFQKAAVMDFYITKYQGKPMESLTPLFKCMTEGVQRLAHQEAEEEKAAVEATRAIVQAENQKPPRKKQKTQEDLARRCRRLTIRIASMANRCFWVSAAELTIHILTDGDCLQSHMNLTLFTKQIQWAMQQCKKILNNDIPEDDQQQEFRNVETVSVQVAATGSRPDSDDEDVKENIDVGKIEACTHSTNTSDDYAHRGPKLSSLPLYVYRMYVRRIPRPGRARAMLPTIFFFEPHYALSASYAQEVVLHNIHVPTIDGFQCPTVEQDAEQNALLKAILFTPWSVSYTHLTLPTKRIV